MTIPIPIYLAVPNRDTPGNHVRWSAGQKARFIGESGVIHDVTILTGVPVEHAAVPGTMCMDVSFDGDGSQLGCVKASALRLR